MFDRNFVFAFLLIFGVFIFFNSDFYNQEILKKPLPAPVVVQKQSENVKQNGKTETAVSQTALAPSPVVAADSALLRRQKEDSLLLANTRTIVVKNGLYEAQFSTLGAVAREWLLVGYKDYKGKPMNLLPDDGAGIFNLALNSYSLDSLLFETTAPDTIVVKERTTLSFTRNLSGGASVTKTFTFTPHLYEVDVAISSTRLPSDRYQFGWKSGIRESEEVSTTFMQMADASVAMLYGEDVEYMDNDESSQDREGSIRWVALRSRYFSGTLMADSARDFIVPVRKLPVSSTSNNNALNFSFLFDGKLEKGEAHYKAVLIPSKYSLLEPYGVQMEKILFKGYSWFLKADIWFPPLAGLLLNLLNFFHTHVGNYGIAILLLTLLVKIITLPLTLKSTKSMARMKLLSPKLKAVQEKHKGDPMAMQQAMMKMYKEEGVSPLGGAGGCLPMLLQMPIFIALFVALRKAIELRGAPFGFWITDLSAPETLFMLPFTIPFYGANFSLLNVVMAVSMYFQTKQTMTGSDPNQKIMLYMMPVIMFFMLNSMPAGLLLYWSLSNILGIAQNTFIKYKPEDLIQKKKEKKKSMWGKKPSYNQILKKMGRK